MSSTAANPLKAYNVPFDSMEPAIATGSDVLGDRSYYSNHKPKRWDVVVFSLPDAKSGSYSGHYVKRIVGLPGETVHLTPRGLKINGALVASPAKLKDQFSAFNKHADHRYGNEPFQVPDGSVFLIGDNPAAFQSDSREFGPIPIRNLEARVLASVHITAVT